MVVEEEGGEGRETNTGLMRILGVVDVGRDSAEASAKVNCKQGHVWQKRVNSSITWCVRRLQRRWTLQRKADRKRNIFVVICSDSFPGCLCCSACVSEASNNYIFTCKVFSNSFSRGFSLF